MLSPCHSQYIAEVQSSAQIQSRDISFPDLLFIFKFSYDTVAPSLVCQSSVSDPAAAVVTNSLQPSSHPRMNVESMNSLSPSQGLLRLNTNSRPLPSSSSSSIVRFINSFSSDTQLDIVIHWIPDPSSQCFSIRPLILFCILLHSTS